MKNKKVKFFKFPPFDPHLSQKHYIIVKNGWHAPDCKFNKEAFKKNSIKIRQIINPVQLI